MTRHRPPRSTSERVMNAGTIDRPLVSRDAAAHYEGRALSWVRARFEPVACHVHTGTLLLDADEVRAVSEATPRRERRGACAA